VPSCAAFQGDIEAITCMATFADDIDQADSIPATLSVSYL
jgi:hypothetical protein